MAALAPNTTARLFVDYVTGTGSAARAHSLTCRYGPGIGGVGAAMLAVQGFLTAIGEGALQNGWAITGLRSQVAGSDVTLPQAMIEGLSAFEGSGGALAAGHEALETTFQGRSPVSGRRVDLSLYGIIYGSFPVSFRWTVAGGVPGFLDEAIAALGAEENTFLCIDGTAPTWYPYANVNYNSYWEGRARRSA